MFFYSKILKSKLVGVKINQQTNDKQIIKTSNNTNKYFSFVSFSIYILSDSFYSFSYLFICIYPSLKHLVSLPIVKSCDTKKQFVYGLE